MKEVAWPQVITEVVQNVKFFPQLCWFQGSRDQNQSTVPLKVCQTLTLTMWNLVPSLLTRWILQTRSRSWFCSSLRWPWMYHSHSLSLSFSICKIDTVIPHLLIQQIYSCLIFAGPGRPRNKDEWDIACPQGPLSLAEEMGIKSERLVESSGKQIRKRST